MTQSDFIGREHELAVLEREYTNTPSFILITGRRRIGKTRLIKEFLDNKDSLYFFSSRIGRTQLLDSFSEAVSGYLGGPSASYGSWKDAMDAFSSREGKKVLVIDEFQNIISSDGNIVPLLQDLWDNMLSKRDVMLILCGSHISVMKSLADDYDGPLYGRFTRHITLGPLPFEIVRNDNYVDSVLRYSVHGGVPRYMERLGDGELTDAVRNNVMDPTSMMFDDPIVLLNDESRDPAGYMSVMKAISRGNHKISDIASALEIPTTALAYTLDRLIEMRLIRREVPVNEREDRSKNGLYVFSDCFTSFWFKFVNPFASALQIGRLEGALTSFESHFIEHHASFVFEDICRESTYRMSEHIGFIPVKVGRYWNRAGMEIDVIALNNDTKQAFVAECKFRSNRPVGMQELKALRSKCEGIDWLKDYDVRYGLFSVSGFEEGLLKEDIILIDKGEIVSS